MSNPLAATKWKRRGDFAAVLITSIYTRGEHLPMGKTIKLNTEEFITKSQLKHNKYVYYATVYRDARTQVWIGCPKHGMFQQLPGNHLKGHGCRECSKESNGLKRRRTKDYLIKEFQKIHGANRYDYGDVVFVRARTKILISCRRCGISFLQDPDNHLRGTGCPICKESKGEIAIRRFLSEQNIQFISQHSFNKTCRNPLTNNILSFDFFLPEFNMCIEYDGIQHAHPHSFSSDQSEEIKQQNLSDLQYRDNIKTQFCVDNNIELLRIPHTDINNIKAILSMYVF
jgi:hypothetical protein